MFKKQFGLCSIALFGLLHMNTASAATLSFNPGNLNVVESSLFEVDVVLSELAGDTVGAFEIAVGYDPLLLTATDVTFSGNLGSTDPFDFETEAGFDLLTPGSVNADELSLLFDFELDALQPGDSVQIATLSFMANSVGTASLAFTSWLISDEFGFEINVQTVEGASIDISPVPLPAALWLMISALLGVGAMARKRAPVRQVTNKFK